MSWPMIVDHPAIYARAKIMGIFIKLKSYSFLCKVAMYLDILEAVGPLSLIFEKNLLMSHEISPVVEKTVLNLEDLCDKGLDYTIDSCLAKFFIKDENGLTTVISNYTKAGLRQESQRTESTIKLKLILLMTTTLIKSHSIQL